MNARERFLAACYRKEVDRPPIWLMRQAGRYLPEYQQLKKKYSFIQMVQTPDLASEVTLQPIRRFAMDAAILFCDILVIPEALGQPYSFREGGGIKMEFALRKEEDIRNLSVARVEDHLQYVPDAIHATREKLGDQTALIGFAGSPWTLATYMVEGGSSKNFAVVKQMLYQHPLLLEQLLNKLTKALIRYFKMQIAAGVDAIQIFDSWGGILTHKTYWAGSARYMAQIVQELQQQVPVIVYSKGAHLWQKDLASIPAQVLGLDASNPLSEFYDALGGKFALQGNMDPVLMNTEPEIVRKETREILQDFGSRPGHIFNLGHGIQPQAKIECVEALVQTVKEHQYA